MVGIIGKKIGMSQLFKENGEVIPVTIIEAGPCPVVEVKTPEKHGYSAVQLAYEKMKEKHANKPMTGHFKKANLEPHRFLTEIRDFDPEYCEVGKVVTVGVFKEGDIVKVTGTTKGRGFQGVVKRHGFAGGPKTHGQSDRLRAPGSIGASSDPSRVIKGLRMAGHMGTNRCTVINLKIVKIDPEHNLIYIKGAVPGARNSIVTIRRQEP